MGTGIQSASIHTAVNSTSIRVFYPSATVRCDGGKVFRSQAARDVGCLLDVDPSVVSWRCMSTAFGDLSHSVDFEVVHDDGRVILLDAHDRELPRDVASYEDAARLRGAEYRRLSREDVHGGFRLKNAKDLLRYGNYTVPLGDRLRLLGALDEHGSMPIAECLNAFQETRPVAGLAAMILNRYLEVDLDDAPLGPETVVRRIAR
ncbi:MULTISPECIES: hypothetical protein [unclassified Ensifer]|uniref:hypothetical protein n=1 Tax=unclassified Ensifer TaxID=2633371 RepID=UPI00081304F6|nr:MULTISPECIES: hypothetical protein [unclassified Ensifer]OCP01417.1 hypothetical protein BC362_22915 [Ensifer sp. LC14]OCP03304.1 hypothetical protein BBX50_06035 [Ensifer sp. LC11]OCP03676.1 hypothetical protein BC374_06095 [Ensifer sp. LC13]OCP34089.1 hypothetical protein BC364_13585 [Ensifer sp. LC499]